MNGNPKFVASPDARHDTVINGNSQNMQVLEGESDSTHPPTGGAVIADFSQGCGTVTLGAHEYPNGTFCPAGTFLQVVEGPFNDTVDATGAAEPVNATLGAGADSYTGSNAFGSVVTGGDGGDVLTTGDAPGQMYGDDGNDTIGGGAGDDTIHIDSMDEFTNHSSGCEHYVIDGG